MNCSYISSKQAVIYTMGYEGATIEDFIATLQFVGIDTIVDVREYPISRKKGFSKTAFSTLLMQAGIKYIHIADLGCPKVIRDEYRIDKNWQKYTASFIEYLNTQTNYIDELGKLAHHAAFCLVCFERDQNFCHRSLVANAIKQSYQTEVRHLGGKKVLTVPQAS